MKHFFRIFILLSFVTLLPVFANEGDSTNSDDDLKFRFRDDWTEIIVWGKYSQPRIDLNYGFSNPIYHENVYSGDFSATNLMEIKLGYEIIKKYKNSESVSKYSFNNLFVSNIREVNTKRNDNELEKIRVEAWRFGFNDANGFAYQLGSGMKFALGTSNGIGWTRLEFLDTAVSPTDQASLDYFGDALRFGTQTEANINIKFSENIGLGASYERAVIFPRHMFWYWTASEIVKGAGNGLITTFVNEIGKSSPSAAPIVYFVLQNAFNYGFYELRQKHMNWPVHTEPPMMFDSFKVGLSLNF